MINEKDLIADLMALPITINNLYSRGIQKGIDIAIEIIVSQPKIGEWILVKDRLPEEKENPATNDYYQYPCIFHSGDVIDIRYFKYGNGHWWNGSCMDNYVTAWMDIYKYTGWSRA